MERRNKDTKVGNEKGVINNFEKGYKIPKGKAIVTFHRSYLVSKKQDILTLGGNLLVNDIYDILQNKMLDTDDKVTALILLFKNETTFSKEAHKILADDYKKRTKVLETKPEMNTLKYKNIKKRRLNE